MAVLPAVSSGPILVLPAIGNGSIMVYRRDHRVVETAGSLTCSTGFDAEIDHMHAVRW
jgi:hypothetical protein